MKTIYLLMFAALFVFCGGCGPGTDGQPQTVGTFKGAQKAYLDEVDQSVQSIEKSLGQMIRYEFDSVDHRQLSTEYAYWQKVHIYVDNHGIRRAKFYADPDEGTRTEELYFDEEGHLIFANLEKEGLLEGSITGNVEGEKYYFTLSKLIYALSETGETRKLKDDTVKINAINLVNEAGQVKKIMANKTLKP